MSNNTFVIVCTILIAIPFIVSCIKGNPLIGAIAGVSSLILMGIAAGQGAPMMMVHLIGLVIAGIGIGYSLHGD
jgi:hypothetical protein